MKKYIVPFIICVSIGLIMGKIMFEQYDKTETVSATVNSYPVYFFQAGVYEQEQNMKNASSRYESYISIKKDDKYYVFLAMTKNEENMEKLKGYFKNLGYDIYVKKINIDNKGFIENLEQYDILLKEATTNDEINAVNKSVLATYEEMMNSGEN